MNIKLIKGDCLEEMNKLNKKVDMILCDLPYGATACKWDNIVPMNDYIEVKIKNKIKQMNYKEWLLYNVSIKKYNIQELIDYFNKNKKEGLWSCYKKLISDKSSILLFGSEPFASMLRTSNLEMYRYDWIWDKGKPSNFQLMNYQCGKVQELILVFSKAKACYTKNNNSLRYIPQMTERKQIRKSNAKIFGNNNLLHTYKTKDNFKIYNKKYPISIIKFNPIIQNKLHSTQKPIALLEYLIKTYTNENMLVLDNCMGSGSTGVACISTNRDFIGIEKDDKYFNIAVNRIKQYIIDNNVENVNLEIIE